MSILGDFNEISNSGLYHPSFAENYEPLPIQLIDIPDCSIKSPLIELSCPFFSLFLQCCSINYVVPKETDQETAQSEKDAEENKHTTRQQSPRQTHTAAQLNIHKHLELK